MELPFFTVFDKSPFLFQSCFSQISKQTKEVATYPLGQHYSIFALITPIQNKQILQKVRSTKFGNTY